MVTIRWGIQGFPDLGYIDLDRSIDNLCVLIAERLKAEGLPENVELRALISPWIGHHSALAEPSGEAVMDVVQVIWNRAEWVVSETETRPDTDPE
jgi:hypothetical protein